MWTAPAQTNGTAKSAGAKRHADAEAGWFDRATMANIFGVSPSTFDREHRKYASTEDIRRDGRRILFHAGPIIRRWAENTYGPGAVCDDPEERALFTGTGGPALERWRDAKARIAEIEYEERIGRVVPIEGLREGLSQIVTILRRAGDKLQKKYGPGPFDIYSNALDEAVAAIEARFSPNANHHEEHEK